MHTANTEIREASSSRLQEVEDNGKSLTFKTKKWLRSLTGGNPKKDTLGRDSGFN